MSGSPRGAAASCKRRLGLGAQRRRSRPDTHLAPSSFWRYSTTVLTPFASGPEICGAGAGLGGERVSRRRSRRMASSHIFSRRRWRSTARGRSGSRSAPADGDQDLASRSSSISTESSQPLAPPSSRWLPLRRLRGCASERTTPPGEPLRSCKVEGLYGTRDSDEFETLRPADRKNGLRFFARDALAFSSRVGTPSTRASKRWRQRARGARPRWRYRDRVERDTPRAPVPRRDALVARRATRRSGRSAVTRMRATRRRVSCRGTATDGTFPPEARRRVPRACCSRWWRFASCWRRRRLRERVPRRPVLHRAVRRPDHVLAARALEEIEAWIEKLLSTLRSCSAASRRCASSRSGTSTPAGSSIGG